MVIAKVTLVLNYLAISLVLAGHVASLRWIASLKLGLVTRISEPCRDKVATKQNFRGK
jgi:hypothetical protein